MCLLVTYFPSLPKNGELLIVNSILIVGSSIVIDGRASGLSGSEIVSPISKPSSPVTAQISPAVTLSTFTLANPSYKKSSFTLVLSTDPSLFTRATVWLATNSPLFSLPIAILPVYLLKSSH